MQEVKKEQEFSFPDPKTTDPKQQKWQRICEVIPGSLTWATLIGMIVFSFLAPAAVAIFIIAFDIYWIHRTVYIAYYSIKAYRKLQEGKTIDWWERCQMIEDPEEYEKMLNKRIEEVKVAKKSLPFFGKERRTVAHVIRKDKSYLKEVRQLAKEGADKIWDWRKIVHVVLLPTANEGPEIIEPSIEAIQKSNFPNQQMIILLATESREPEEQREQKVKYLKEKFKGVFRDFIVTTHEVTSDEMKCKGSNATYACKQLVKYLEKEEIDTTRVILSNFDCDSVVHGQYFAALTYAYITDPKRLQRAYQPLPMYHNNLWDTNAFVRVVVTSSSFWHMYQSTRSEMVTFSSHSEPFDTLMKVNFWPVNMISEDSIIYWKCIAYFNGDYRVQPVYLPISLDAVLAPTYWQTIKNQYKQKRRWAYGIENFPIIMRSIVPNKRISIMKKAKTAMEMLEGHHSWATAPFILAFLGWLPLILGGVVFNESVLAHNLPFFTRYLMTIAMTGLVVSVSLSFLLLPKRPGHHKRSRYIHFTLQWLLVPIIAPTLGAIPAIDAQTRILIKKYFGEFWVTDKIKLKKK